MLRWNRRRARGDQSGFSLLELLVAMAISSIIIGPVAAWSVSTMRHQGTARDELGRATATGLLNTYFLRDVASARFASVPEAPAADLLDCAEPVPASPSPSAGGRVVLTVISSGASPQRIVYKEVGGSATSPAALWRRVCDATGAGAVRTDETEIFRAVRFGSTQAGCPAPGSTDCSSYRTVTLELQPASATGGNPGPVRISAVRRTDAGSTGLGAVVPPIARAGATPTRGYRATKFTLDSSASVAPDGGIASHAWTLPAGAVFVDGTGPADQTVVVSFPAGDLGERTVFLRVTDAGGRESIGWVTVVVSGRYPTARAIVAPTAAVDTFDLSAAGSSDPDDPSGASLSYRWAMPDGTTLAGVTNTWTAPLGLIGPQQLTLTVTDPDGYDDSFVLPFEIGTVTTFPGGVEITPSPIGSGTGRPPLVGSVGPGRSLAVTFQVPALDPTPAGSSTGWRLYRAGSATVFADSPGESWTHTFLGADFGGFEVVRLTIPDGGSPVEGPRVEFRINRAPVAVSAIVASGGTVPKVVTFTSAGSTDPDGTIVSRLWQFGAGGPTSSDPDPTHTFDTAGTYVVTLGVVDDDGAVTSSTQTVTVGP